VWPLASAPQGSLLFANLASVYATCGLATPTLKLLCLVQGQPSNGWHTVGAQQMFTKCSQGALCLGLQSRDCE
jgi:hypothetical protein